MANTLEFVTPALATSLDISSYVESGTNIPLPPHSKVWAGNITAHGAKYITGKYELVPITLALKITGTSKSDLDDEIRALIVEITKKNILKWQPESATSAIYYTTYPYDTAEAQTILSKAHRDAFITYPFTITLMADPFAWGAEQTITVVENLCPNWNMEDFTGDDPDDWTVTETAGAGAASITQRTTAGDYVFGASSVRFTATADDSVAQITTTDFITVTNTLHYFICFNHERSSGTSGQLECIIKQYSAADVDLADDITIATTNVTVENWKLRTTIIYPVATGGNDFHASCAKIKIIFRVTGVTGGDSEVYQVDGIFFGCARYLSSYMLTNPLGIIIPPAALSGDVPSPCDIYLSAWDTTVDSHNGIYVGGRKEYGSGFVPHAPADTGTAAYSNIANRGDYMTIAVGGDLVVNGGFENITGDAADGNFDDWTESESNGDIKACSGSYARSGTYALWFDSSSYAATASNVITTTAYINNGGLDLDPAEDYLVEFYYKSYVGGMGTGSGYQRLKCEILCYNSSNASTGTLTPLNTTAIKSSYTQVSYAILAGTATALPASTVKIKIRFTMNGRMWDGDAYDNFQVDDVVFYQSSTSLALTAAFDLDSIKGYVKPFLHAKLGVADSDLDFALDGKLTDGTNDITDFEGITSSDGQALDNAWEYVDGGLESFEVPNVRISDSATTTGLDQEFKLGIANIGAGSTPLSLDDLVLIPIDNGYCAVPALEDTQYLVLDSTSDMAGVLKSYDGTITNAARLSNATMSSRFYLDPQNGSNLAILEKWIDASNNEYGQLLMDVVIKYRPFYLIVA